METKNTYENNKQTKEIKGTRRTSTPENQRLGKLKAHRIRDSEVCKLRRSGDRKSKKMKENHWKTNENHRNQKGVGERVQELRERLEKDWREMRERLQRDSRETKQ